MAYQFADGFDNYGNAFTMASGYPWSTIGNYSSGGTGTAVVTTGDFQFSPPGSLAGGCVSVNQNNYIRQTLAGTPGTLIAGFGIKLPSLPGGIGDICDLWDSGGFQCGIQVNSNGALQFYRGNGAAPGSGGNSSAAALGTPSANNTVIAGSWAGLLFQIVVATSTGGSVQLYVNGNSTPAISVTGLNTSGSGNQYATQIGIGPGNFASAKYDDFFCIDTTGGFLNSRPSNATRILTKVPNAAGTYTNWTPTGLGSNWQNAAVAPPSISDYNANNTGGTKDSYSMQSAGLTVTPLFVLARASLRMDDAGPHTPSLLMRSGGVDATAVATAALTSSYLFYDSVFQNDPNTGSPWLGSAADSAQVGIVEG